MKNFKCSTLLDKHKVNGKGEAPVYFRINTNNTKATFSSGVFVNVTRWKATKGFKTTRQIEEKMLRNKLEDKIKQMNNLVEGCEGITAEMIVNEVTGKNKVRNNTTLFQLWDMHKDYFNKQVELGELVLDGYKKYNSVKAKLKTYLKEEYHLTDIPLSRLDDGFNTGFHSFLKGSVSHNIAIKYVVLFRAVVKYGVQNRLIDAYPFQHYKMSLKKKDVTILTQSEVDTINEREFEIDRINKVKDVFLFCCYTGLNYVDVFLLKKTDVLEMNSEMVLNKPRQKTKEMFFIPLLPAALELINKYAEHPDCSDGQLFPVNKNQRMNCYLKEIQECCSITKNLTCKVARFTFATIALNAGMNPVAVQNILGHSRLQQTMHYARIQQTTVLAESKKLNNVFKTESQKHLKVA
jgi:site-specific recombinase XerD